MLSQGAVGLKAHKYAVCAAARILTLPPERWLQPAATGEIVPLPRKHGVPILCQARHRGQCQDASRAARRLIELGVDVLDPIQPVSPDIQPGALKAAYGRQLSFHGGIDMQHLLPHDTPDEVTAEARRYGELLGAGGGYILGPAHLFQPDVPPENILAVYRA